MALPDPILDYYANNQTAIDAISKYLPNLVSAESTSPDFPLGGDPMATSPKGAMGAMQLMPSTASWLAEKLGLDTAGINYRDDELNRALGTIYLAEQFKTFGTPELALAAYNAGPGTVSRALPEGGSYADIAAMLPKETQDYVRKIVEGATGTSLGMPTVPGAQELMAQARAQEMPPFWRYPKPEYKPDPLAGSVMFDNSYESGGGRLAPGLGGEARAQINPADIVFSVPEFVSAVSRGNILEAAMVAARLMLPTIISNATTKTA